MLSPVALRRKVRTEHEAAVKLNDRPPVLVSLRSQDSAHARGVIDARSPPAVVVPQSALAAECDRRERERDIHVISDRPRP